MGNTSELAQAGDALMPIMIGVGVLVLLAVVALVIAFVVMRRKR